jgi:D-tyrosyl-tRNA(Tyr) deacylase
VTIDLKVVFANIQKVFNIHWCENADTQEDIDWLASKIVGLRIFEMRTDIMIYRFQERDGDIIGVSQLHFMLPTKKESSFIHKGI